MLLHLMFNGERIDSLKMDHVPQIGSNIHLWSNDIFKVKNIHYHVHKIKEYVDLELVKTES